MLQAFAYGINYIIYRPFLLAFSPPAPGFRRHGCGCPQIEKRVARGKPIATPT